MPTLTPIPSTPDRDATADRYRIDDGPDTLIRYHNHDGGLFVPIVQVVINHHRGSSGAVSASIVLTTSGPISTVFDWAPLDEAILSTRARILATLEPK